MRQRHELLTVGSGRVIADPCRAFEGSYNKQPVASTLLNLADCHEKNGKLASAWSAFVEAERQSRSDPKMAAAGAVAKERAVALEPRPATITSPALTIPNPSGVAGKNFGQAMD